MILRDVSIGCDEREYRTIVDNQAPVTFTNRVEEYQNFTTTSTLIPYTAVEALLVLGPAVLSFRFIIYRVKED